MINLSLDMLRLIAQIRNISNYENKSKEHLIKAFNQKQNQNKYQNQKRQKKNQNQNKKKSKN